MNYPKLSTEIMQAGVLAEHKQIDAILKNHGLDPAQRLTTVYRVQIYVPMELAEEMNLSFNRLSKEVAEAGFALTVENTQNFYKGETTYGWSISIEI